MLEKYYSKKEGKKEKNANKKMGTQWILCLLLQCLCEKQ